MRASSWTRLAALVVWGAAAACAALWGLRLFASPMPMPPHAGTASTTQVLRGDLALLLGVTPEEPAEDEGEPLAVAAARFQLLGVVAPKAPGASREGLALIAVDGKPARAYRVGSSVEGELVLQTVRIRGADLGARGGPASVALNLSALPGPATGVPGRPAQAAPLVSTGGAAPSPGSAGPSSPAPSFSASGRPGGPPQARPLTPARSSSEAGDDDGESGAGSDHPPGEALSMPPAQRQLLSTH